MTLLNAVSVLTDFMDENRTILEFRAWTITFSGTDGCRTNVKFQRIHLELHEGDKIIARKQRKQMIGCTFEAGVSRWEATAWRRMGTRTRDVTQGNNADVNVKSNVVTVLN
jgi:hypothetical protein